MELKYSYYYTLQCNSFLLIAPYGIEIMKLNHQKEIIEPINRTLWNWNNTLITCIGPSSSINRTLWNWNYMSVISSGLRLAINRTLWNWNCRIYVRSPFFSILLIAPYGIEIWKYWAFAEMESRLLIAPYGIEIFNFCCFCILFNTINRTLWNWNYSDVTK